MSRPQKNGISYFSFDVDFFEDRKIGAIMGEFGCKGESIALRVLCLIYRDKGYWAKWDNLTKYDIARKVVGVKPRLVEEVVLRLVECGFFDNCVFDSFQVLTSKGIQARYFDATHRRYKDNPRQVDDLPYLLIENPYDKGLSKTVNVDVNYPPEGVNVDVYRQSKVKNINNVNEGGNVQRETHVSESLKKSETQNPPPPDFAFSEMRCSPTAEALLTETIAAWNGIPHTAPVKFTIVPESIRLEFYKRLQEFGDDGIRNAVAGMQEADFFKTKAKTKPSFLQFLKDKMFQGCIDGTYQNVHENKTPNKENLNETARDRLSPEDRAFFDSIGK